MTQPTVSVLIPTYKGEQFILETLQSVFAQDFEDFEVIVVIDGSPDNTRTVIEGLDPRLIIIEQENKGIAEARNEAIRRASGRYFAFLDHDDIWHPGKLTAQLQCFETDPDLGIVFASFSRWPSDEAQKEAFSKTEPDPADGDDKLSGWIYHQMILTNWILLGSALFRAEVVREIGWFSPELPPSDDWDFNVRVAQKYRTYKMRQPLILYRVFPEQTSRQLTQLNAAAEFRLALIEKYGLASEDGSTIDRKEIDYAFFKDYFDFGLMHYHRGSASVATGAFIDSLKYRPLYWKTYALLLLSMSRQLFRIRRQSS
jgi:glycosyltransferase involved in cell wall biosynthesis